MISHIRRSGLRDVRARCNGRFHKLQTERKPHGRDPLYPFRSTFGSSDASKIVSTTATVISSAIEVMWHKDNKNLERTRMCDFWQRFGNCLRKEDCTFAHGPGEVVQEFKDKGNWDYFRYPNPIDDPVLRDAAGASKRTSKSKRKSRNKKARSSRSLGKFASGQKRKLCSDDAWPEAKASSDDDNPSSSKARPSSHVAHEGRASSSSISFTPSVCRNPYLPRSDDALRINDRPVMPTKPSSSELSRDVSAEQPAIPQPKWRTAKPNPKRLPGVVGPRGSARVASERQRIDAMAAASIFTHVYAFSAGRETYMKAWGDRVSRSERDRLSKGRVCDEAAWADVMRSNEGFGKHVVVCDFSKFSNPEAKHKKDGLLFHCGSHIGIIENLVADDQFQAVWARLLLRIASESDAAARDVDGDQRVYVLMLCRSGRHRSVAAKTVWDAFFRRELERTGDHFSRRDGEWNHLCEVCDPCTWKNCDETTEHVKQKVQAIASASLYSLFSARNVPRPQ